MPTGHIDTCYTSMRHGIIPGSHRVVLTNGRVVEFSHISCRIDARNIGLHVIVDDYPTTNLNRRMGQKFGVQCDPKANADNICLNLSSILRLYITWNTILGYD